jgi:hypothetical protein
VHEVLPASRKTPRSDIATQTPPVPRCRVVGAIQGHISEVIEEPNAEPPETSDPGDGDDDGDDDGDGDPESGTMSEEDDPIPNPDPNAEANCEEQVGCRLLVTLERLVDNGLGGGAERHGSRAKLREPDPFDGRTQRNSEAFSSSAC